MTTETFIQNVETIYDSRPAYERGHDGSDGFCDCIGLIKGALRRGGETPTGLKGTNYAARYTLRNFRTINSTKDLHLGDAVVKAIQPGQSGYDLPDEYKEGGINYNGDLTDYCHIGVVTGLSPLVITHMTSPTAQKDYKIGKWKFTGSIPQVDGSEPAPDPGPSPAPEQKTATVRAPSGETVNMRKGPSTSKALVERVPIGSRVTILDEEPDWCQISYTDPRGATWYGWMMTQFLKFDEEPEPEPEPGPQPPAGDVVLTLEKADAVRVWELLDAVTGDVFPVLADLCTQIYDQIGEG